LDMGWVNSRDELAGLGWVGLSWVGFG
jgi:hypothetical protein